MSENFIRRYDVDSVRVLAIFLLIVYHSVIGFQPWGKDVYFIVNKDFLESIWLIMMAINIWRIPILFVVSGMGVYFAMRRRTAWQLIGDRAYRIFLPFWFGVFFIAPIHEYLFYLYNEKIYEYTPTFGHLWFLFNIFIYILFLLPVFIYFKKFPGNFIFKSIRYLISKPFVIIPVFSLPIVIEVLLLQPKTFEGYILEPGHGFILGLLCFLSGVIFVSLGKDFWISVQKAKFLSLVLSISFYLIRILVLLESEFKEDYSNLFLAIECSTWMLAIFGFAATYFNRPSKALSYLSSAVYPVYIFHMIAQYSFSILIFPIGIPALIKYLTLVTATIGGSFLLYEIFKRIQWVRILVGISR